MKLKRYLVALLNHLEELKNVHDAKSSAAAALGKRVESLSADLNTLRSQVIGLSHAIEDL